MDSLTTLVLYINMGYSSPTLSLKAKTRAHTDYMFAVTLGCHKFSAVNLLV
jgi:hypothetical protein